MRYDNPEEIITWFDFGLLDDAISALDCTDGCQRLVSAHKIKVPTVKE
jgi:hypothetical protein